MSDDTDLEQKLSDQAEWEALQERCKPGCFAPTRVAGTGGCVVPCGAFYAGPDGVVRQHLCGKCFATAPLGSTHPPEQWDWCGNVTEVSIMSADGTAIIAELMPVPGYNMIDTATRLTNCVNGCRRIKEPHKDVPTMLDLLFRLCGDDPSKLYLSETGKEGAALVAKILHPQPCPPS